MTDKIRVEVEIGGGEQVKNELKGIVDSVQNNANGLSSAFSKIGDIIDRLGIRSLGVSSNIARIGVDLGHAAEAASGTSIAMAQLGSEMGGVTGAVVTMSGLLASTAIRITAIGIATATAIAGLLKLGTTAGETAAKISDAASAAGLSVGSFEKYATAAKMLNLPDATLNGFSKLKDFFKDISDRSDENTKKLQELNKQLSDLETKKFLTTTLDDARKLTPQIDTLREKIAKLRESNNGLQSLGLDFKYLSSSAVSTEQAFNALQKSLSQLKSGNSTQYAQAIQELKKALGPDFVKLLETSGASITRWSGLLDDVAGKLPAETAKIGEALRNSENFLGLAVDRLRERIGLAFTPASNQANIYFANVLLRNKQSIDDFIGFLTKAGEAVKVFFQILDGDTLARRQNPTIAAYADAVNTIGSAFSRVVGIVKSTYNQIDAVLTTVSTKINQVFGTNVTSGTLQFIAILGGITGGFKLLATAAGIVIAPLLRVVGVISELALFSAKEFLVGLFTPLIASAGSAITAVLNVGRAFTFLSVANVASFLSSIFGPLIANAANAISAIRTVGATLLGLETSGLAVSLGGLFGPLMIAAVIAGAAIGYFWDDIKRGATAAYEWISSAFQNLPTTIEQIFSSVSSTISGAFVNAQNGINRFLDEVVLNFLDLKKSVESAWSDLVQSISSIAKDIGSSVTKAISSGISSLPNPFTGILDYARDAIISVENGFSDLVNWISRILNNIAQSASRVINSVTSSMSGGSLFGYADGGYINGPGTSTSDSILARLSNGEFVVKASTVSAFGADFFHRLNNMQMPSMNSNLPGFASGGLVASAPAAVTSAGGRSFTLVIDGKKFGNLSGSMDTIGNLEKYAVMRQLTATSKRTPSRIG